jgi:hypothetical protein
LVQDAGETVVDLLCHALEADPQLSHVDCAGASGGGRSKDRCEQIAATAVFGLVPGARDVPIDPLVQ